MKYLLVLIFSFVMGQKSIADASSSFDYLRSESASILDILLLQLNLGHSRSLAYSKIRFDPTLPPTVGFNPEKNQINIGYFLGFDGVKTLSQAKEEVFARVLLESNVRTYLILDYSGSSSSGFIWSKKGVPELVMRDLIESISMTVYYRVRSEMDRAISPGDGYISGLEDGSSVVYCQMPFMNSIVSLQEVLGVMTCSVR